MKPFEIKKDIHWVGVVDWNKRNFHGYSRSPMGTTYNAFLVQDEKTVLIDTVEADYKDSFFCSLAHLTELEKIDYMVVNHLEPDHSGCLAEIVARAKPEKIFTSKMGEKAMQAHYHYTDWPVQVVGAGDKVDIGSRTLTFVETRMLHWPDNMFTYIPEDKLAITSDAFGQNIASTERFADEVDPYVLDLRLREYYANIVLPYSPQVLKILDQVAASGLEIDMLCPDHGLLYRGEGVGKVLEAYRRFAEQKPGNKAVVLYDTMWHSTEHMAEAVTQGLYDQGVSVRLMNAKVNHHSDVMTELMDAGALCVGSPTHNNGILPKISEHLTYIKGLRPQNKVGAVFGSFGWSGECIKILSDWLASANIKETAQGVKVKNVPTHEVYKQCVDLGAEVGRALKASL